MRHWLVLALLLGGCLESGDNVVTMAPQLVCREAVQCSGYHWHVGFSKQAIVWIEGNRLSCQCASSALLNSAPLL